MSPPPAPISSRGEHRQLQSFERISPEDLAHLSRSDFDALPFGAIRLDMFGTVLAYNTQEANLARRDKTEVIGQNFWLEIAPCTNIDAFRGRLEGLAAQGGGTVSFDFDFKFPWGKRSVRIRLLVENKMRWVFVREIA